MKRWFVFLVFLLVIVHYGIFAQYAGDRAIYHVSGLRVEIRNNLVRLSWTDSPDALGPVHIFRSARPFSASIPLNIKPVVVPYGVGTFIDEIDGSETVHYFVAASDLNGQRFDVFVPIANTASVSYAPLTESAPAAASVTGGLAARADGERVIITHYSDNTNKDTVLYRSTQPIMRRSDLLNASIVRSGMGAQFIDYPIPGFPWYYAVIYEDEIVRGNVEIRPGINATTSAVVISGGFEAAGAIRSIPLPFITAYFAAPSYGNYFWKIPEKVPLGVQAQKALEDLSMPQKPPLSQKRPQVFSRDMEFPGGGEEASLMQIVQDSFSKRDWEKARIELQNYLGLPRSKEVEGRARFYLGQCWYFAGKYREALVEFLSVQSRYPAQANDWIDASLAALIH
jgi:hypothetical protein